MSKRILIVEDQDDLRGAAREQALTLCANFCHEDVQQLAKVSGSLDDLIRPLK